MTQTDPLFLIAAIAAAIIIGLAKGGLGGIGTLAVPVLALVISPVKAAALLLPILVVSDVFGLWLYRRNFDRRNLLILIPSAAIGVAAGWSTAAFVSDRMVGLFVGLIGVSFCANLWFRRRHAFAARPADLRRGIFWGAILGFTSFVSHAGAPPFQVYVLPQRLEKNIYAGTTTITFAAVNAIKLVPYWALGQLSMTNLRTALFLFPVAIVSTFIGVRLVRIIPEKVFFNFVNITLFVVSVKLIADAALR